MEIKNAQITRTMLGREDHEIFTFMIFVKCEGWECGVGGYALDYYNKELGERVYSAKSLEAVSKLLDVVGVDKWEDLKGKYIRVKDNGWGSTIDEIGNLIENKWFNLREFFGNKEGV
jgi:hypothetical protein